MVGCREACLAASSTFSLPGIPLCPGTQIKTIGIAADAHVSKRICMCDVSEWVRSRRMRQCVE